MTEFGLLGHIKVVLITNGSLIHRVNVQEGLRRLKTLGGEVWFKLDRGTRAGMHLVNQTEATLEQVLRRLTISAQSCPTWIQSCFFALDGIPPDEEEVSAYLGLLQRAIDQGLALQGVMLYGLARASMQPEAPRLSVLPEAWLEALVQRVNAIVPTVHCYP